jgi:hypothetical protein
MRAELRPILQKSYVCNDAPHGYHCPEREYERFIHSIALGKGTNYAAREMAVARRFTKRWPDLHDWFEEPLHVRVGVKRFDRQEAMDARITSDARPYLLYLALRGNLRFDYPLLPSSSGTPDRGAGLASLHMPSSVRVTSRGFQCGFRASSRMLSCNA